MSKHAFTDAMNEHIRQLLAQAKKREELNWLRSGRGWPTVEQELGWRSIFRGSEGARD